MKAIKRLSWRAMFLLGAFASASASSAQDSAEAVPPAIERLLANRTTDPRLETAQQPLPGMVERARGLGLRTDGFYYFHDTDEDEDGQTEILTDYFRFCGDGWVVGAVVVGKLDVASVRRWLTCEPMNRDHSHGALRVDGSQFSFIMTTAPTMPDYRGEIDYWGQIQPDAITLHMRSRIREAQTYMQIQTHTLRFAPLAERAN